MKRCHQVVSVMGVGLRPLASHLGPQTLCPALGTGIGTGIGMGIARAAAASSNAKIAMIWLVDLAHSEMTLQRPAVHLARDMDRKPRSQPRTSSIKQLHPGTRGCVCSASGLGPKPQGRTDAAPGAWLIWKLLNGRSSCLRPRYSIHTARKVYCRSLQGHLRMVLIN